MPLPSFDGSIVGSPRLSVGRQTLITASYVDNRPYPDVTFSIGRKRLLGRLSEVAGNRRSAFPRMHPLARQQPHPCWHAAQSV